MLIVGILAVFTTSLYKYNIEHFNSVIVDQGVVFFALLVYFSVQSYRQHHKPWRLLLGPVTGSQSLLSGVAMVLQSFAFSFAPASIIISAKRALEFYGVWSLEGSYFMKLNPAKNWSHLH